MCERNRTSNCKYLEYLANFNVEVDDEELFSPQIDVLVLLIREEIKFDDVEILHVMLEDVKDFPDSRHLLCYSRVLQ